jgi:hypothetical protein
VKSNSKDNSNYKGSISIKVIKLLKYNKA